MTHIQATGLECKPHRKILRAETLELSFAVNHEDAAQLQMKKVRHGEMATEAIASDGKK